MGFNVTDGRIGLLIVYTKAKFDNLEPSFLAKLKKRSGTMTAKHDAEMDTFQNDLLESVRQMNGETATVTELELTPVASLRARTGLSQTQFARLLGVSVRTLQQWEQG